MAKKEKEISKEKIKNEEASKEKIKDEEILKEKIQSEEVNDEEISGETALEEIEPELEETEGYKKANFGEKISLKFRKKLITSRFNTLLLIVFLVAVVWAINFWADKQNLAQIDVTKNKLYSLTDTSKDQLKTLDKEVNIYVYGYTDQDNLYQFLQQYNHFNKNIKNQIITESDNYELISKYGLGTYSALIIACGDKDKIIYPDFEFTTTDDSNGDEIDLAEESITNAILKVSTDDPVKVYFATGNGGYSKDTLTTLSAYLEYQVYETQDLNLLTVTEIPEDCDILAILGPEEDLSSEQAEMIKNYANNGGNLLVCALTPDDGEFTNLQSVLDLYGVKINKGLLYEGDSNRYIASRNMPLNYVLIPGYSSSNPITEKFYDAKSEQTIIMPWSQGLTINDVTEENVTVESSEIVMTSDSCYNVENYQNGFTSDSLNNLDKTTYTIGSELTRKVTNGDNTVESKLVIYGNTTFFTDSYRNSVIQINVMENNGNINLALNTFAELAEEDNLLTIRKAANVLTFQNTESEDRVVQLIIFGVPTLIIIIGIIIWNRRRKKR